MAPGAFSAPDLLSIPPLRAQANHLSPAAFAHVQALDHDAPAIDVAASRSVVTARTFSFGDELPAVDVIFCGALIHWVFCLTADFHQDFDRIVSYLASRAKHYLIIEWVEPNDRAIKQFDHIKRCGPEAIKKYSRDSFVSSLLRFGCITVQKSFDTRTLFTVRMANASANDA